jgi:hypothetical protein
MAVPMLAKEYSKDYVALLEQRALGTSRLSGLEKERFGWSHSEVAGQMARRWKLPEGTAHLIERHTAIDELMTDAAAPKGEVAVALSALLPTTSDERWYELDLFEKFYDRARTKNTLSIPETLTQVDAEFKEFAPVLKITAPSKTLVECYQEAIAAR